MSKFTTEVRWICETFANEQDEYQETITNTIKTAAPYIFDDSWTTQDPAYKPTLEYKILRHYYTQEIGYETVNLWMLHLNAKLCEIMPKYNVLYANLSAVKEKLFQNADLTETQDLTNNNKTTGKSDSTTDASSTNNTNTSGTSKGKSDSTSDGTTSDKQSSSNSGTNKGTTSSNSDTWQESNDTPQGGLNGLENRTYLSSAVHNRGTTSGTNSAETSANASSDTSGTTHDTTTGNTSGETTGTSDSTTHDASKASATTSGTSDTTENYVKKIIGKNSGGEYGTLYMDLVKGYQDIDMMIIEDLEPLFMSLWE